MIGECKFKNIPFSYSEYLNTKAKLTPLKDTAKFYYALFSQSGFDNKIMEEVKIENNLQLYDLKEIVNFNQIK